MVETDGYDVWTIPKRKNHKSGEVYIGSFAGVFTFGNQRMEIIRDTKKGIVKTRNLGDAYDD